MALLSIDPVSRDGNHPELNMSAQGLFAPPPTCNVRQARLDGRPASERWQPVSGKLDAIRHSCIRQVNDPWHPASKLAPPALRIARNDVLDQTVMVNNHNAEEP
jgi:hypothetical protein